MKHNVFGCLCFLRWCYCLIHALSTITMFFSKSFLLHLGLWSFELMFVYGVRWRSSFILLRLDIQFSQGFVVGSVVKKYTCNAGDSGSIPWLGRSPREGNGNPLQYSCLGNPMDRGAWQTKELNTIYWLSSNNNHHLSLQWVLVVTSKITDHRSW